MKLVELQPTTGPLPRNPAMGWAIYIDQDGTSLVEDGRGRLLDPDLFWKRMETALPFANQLYIRLPWSEYEPEQGRYAWEHNPRFREIIAEGCRRGLRLAFRWYTDGRDCHRQATPDFVRAAGAAGDTLPADGKGPVDGRWWWTPWSDDPVLHRCLAGFVEAFAARFDNVETTDLVDHGLGRWGEMHSFVLADMGRYNVAAPQILLQMAELHQRLFRQVIRCHNFGGWNSDRAVEDKVLGDLGHCIRRDGLGSPRWFNRTEAELLASYWPQVPVFGDPGDWVAGEPYQIVDQFTMPALPACHYRWAVALVDRCRHDQPWITLAAASAEPGWVPLEGAP